MKANQMNEFNIIHCSDNLSFMKMVPTSSADMVYLDPPVLGGDRLSVAKSPNKRPFELIEMLRPRIEEIHRILKDTGSLFCQIDWRIDKEIQILLDEIFEEQNLIAKIIWQYGKPTTKSVLVPHTYDVIFFYGKTREVKYFPQFSVYYDDKKEAQYKYSDPETGSRYRLVGLTRPNTELSSFTYEFLGITRNWRFSKEKMENELKQGRIIQSKPGAVPMHKEFIGETNALGDVWSDLPMQSVSKETTGYPTQKPLALLDRIIKMSTEKGDLVLDPFCGSGTSLVAAEKLGRKWVGVDISPTACQIAGQRLKEIHKATPEKLLRLQDSRTLEDIKNMPHYEFESWAIASLEKMLLENPEFARSKGLDPISDIKVYSIAKDVGFDMELRSLQVSIPVIVKRTEKIAAREINNFAVQLRHHNREKGLFVAISFSKGALNEIKTRQIDGFQIIPICARELLSEKT